MLIQVKLTSESATALQLTKAKDVDKKAAKQLAKMEKEIAKLKAAQKELKAGQKAAKAVMKKGDATKEQMAAITKSHKHVKTKSTKVAETTRSTKVSRTRVDPKARNFNARPSQKRPPKNSTLGRRNSRRKKTSGRRDNVAEDFKLQVAPTMPKGISWPAINIAPENEKTMILRIKKSLGLKGSALFDGKISKAKFWDIVKAIGWGTKTGHSTKVQNALRTVLSDDALSQLEKIGDSVTGALSKKSQKLWLDETSGMNIGDDGFSDLVAHAVGLGKDVYSAVLKNPKLLMIPARENKYIENFTYSFHPE